MRKTLFLAILALSFFTKEAEAALVVVDKNGEVTVNVLSSESSLALSVANPVNLDIKQTVEKGLENVRISLKRDGENVKLIAEDRELDVTKWRDDVVTLEERQGVHKVEISLKENAFAIKQNDLVAETNYPINIDPKENKITLETETGEKFLAVLPYDAAMSTLRAKVLTSVNKNMRITEEEKDLSYAIEGERVINFFNIYELSIPVKTKVSASTGELLFVDQPVWLNILGYLLV